MPIPTLIGELAEMEKRFEEYRAILHNEHNMIRSVLVRLMRIEEELYHTIHHLESALIQAQKDEDIEVIKKVVEETLDKLDDIREIVGIQKRKSI